MNHLEIQTNDLFYHLHKQFLVKLGIIQTSHVRGPTMLPDSISQSEINEMIHKILNKFKDYKQQQLIINNHTS